MIKTHKIKIYPNKTMLKEINVLFDYRRYIWNQSLGLWNDMYDESLIFDNKSLRPNGNVVRNNLVDTKQDWQYQLSARVLQQTVSQLLTVMNMNIVSKSNMLTFDDIQESR